MGPSTVPSIYSKGSCLNLVGIVAAMRVEAQCITSRHVPLGKMVNLGENAAIWLCGMGEEAARNAATRLQERGANSLISFGIAGALEPILRPGDLILPESIYTENLLLPVSLNWRNRIQEHLPSHLRVIGGKLAASQKVLTSILEKHELAQSTGACAVDLESGAVAKVAADANIPFLAIRAIADPVEFSPPSTLLGAIHQDGSANLVRILSLLLKGSVNLSTLLRLAKELRTARSTLSTVVSYAGMELGIQPNRATKVN